MWSCALALYFQTTDRKAWTALPVQFNFTVTEEEFHGSELIGKM